jgi:hypothetical protein
MTRPAQASAPREVLRSGGSPAGGTCGLRCHLSPAPIWQTRLFPMLRRKQWRHAVSREHARAIVDTAPDVTLERDGFSLNRRGIPESGSF